MGPGDYAAVFGVWLVAIAAPGPDVVLVLRETVRGGRAGGVAAASGIAIGIVVWIALAMAGAHALVEADPRVLGALQVAGGSYLVVLGLGALRASRGGSTEQLVALAGHESAPPQAAARRARLRRSFVLGAATNLSNPKALIFFGTVFTVLIPASASTADRVLLSVLLVASEAVWFSGLALVASSGRLGTRLSASAARLDLLAGGAFVLLGTLAIAAGVAGL
ncbi:MAG: LysE family transporter [Solirubrobacteraceae bacterium]|nr:LysE family transporter [Solirubrobacteraceae bacterium]